MSLPFIPSNIFQNKFLDYTYHSLLRQRQTAWTDQKPQLERSDDGNAFQSRKNKRRVLAVLRPLTDGLNLYFNSV